MLIKLFLLLSVGVALFNQVILNFIIINVTTYSNCLNLLLKTNAFNKFSKPKCLKCCSHILHPKPLPWSKPMCLSKCDDLCVPAKIKYGSASLPCLSIENIKNKKLNFKNLHSKQLFEDCNCHKSGECLYEFCRDCKDFVHDKLIDLKHCVVNDICDKLKEKVIV